ncbi:hypothetical protein LguiA_010459 [Lonicera macranthoides]
MGPTEEEIATNELASSAELKTNEFPKSSAPVYTDMLEDNILNRSKMSLAGYEFSCTSPFSTSIAGPMVEELTVRNYKIPDSSLFSSSISREELHCGQSQWQHLWAQRNLHADYIFGDENPMRLSPRKLPRGLQDNKPWSSKQDNQDLDGMNANLINNYNKIPSSSSFSQFFAKQSSKGKGVLSKSPETFADSRAAAMAKSKEKRSVHNKAASDASTKSTAKIESCVGGINLREWLTPMRGEKNKVERLHVFRQIVQLVDFAHSQGVFLRHLRPSFFAVWPSNKVKYVGTSTQMEKMSIMNQNINRKRPLEQEMNEYSKLGVKQQKIEDMKLFRYGMSSEGMEEIESKISGQQDLDYTKQQSKSVIVQLEKKWYASPEELSGRCLLSSNIYSLGVLLFELLCCFETIEAHSAAMLELRQRILTPNFLSEHPKEAGYCLWLLHPDPSSRPTTREILQSEIACKSEELYSRGDLLPINEDDEDESNLLDYFLLSMKETKQKHASELLEKIRCLEEDIKEIERRHLLKISSDGGPHPRDNICSTTSVSISNLFKARLTKNMSKLENAYFYKRSEIQSTETTSLDRSDKELLRTHLNKKTSMERKPIDCLTDFFEGVFKFARYSRFEVCGTLRNSDLLNSANVICSLSFDRDEDYIAAAGVSKKIKIFEFASLLNDCVDIHYPVVEMLNKSKLSCVCWNKYIKNYLASTDYDGVVQMWDANTGQGFSQYVEHQKRAWSVDFSQVDPMKFASGSDDCSVKLWSINEKRSIGNIQNPANVCCVQFSPYSSHLLAFGCADYKIYGYDLRHTRIPWCTLVGHGKAVSYVKFLDSETLVSASTDNTIKLWDLNKTNLEGLSPKACTSSFSGHTNEKNFVGLSVFDGYIACGSETNEVYAYYRSLPMPITSHKFGCVDPLSGQEVNDSSNGQFVSSVCWRGKSNMVVAANSSGNIKLLQMV